MKIYLPQEVESTALKGADPNFETCVHKLLNNEQDH